MQKWKIACIFLMLTVLPKLNAQDFYGQRVQDYIQKYKDWAIEEQRRSGVPAAITLAQGIHETAAGNSELALNANNHFGIKCKREWNGETYAYTDDAPNECFRKYPSAFQSFRDHSDYLRGSQRYASLFQLSSEDYKGWCTGLKRCGYATNPRYSQILIRIIESYNLQQFTYAALSPDYNPVKDAATEPQILTDYIPPKSTIPADTPVTSPPAKENSSLKKSNMSVSYGSDAAGEKKNDEERNLQPDKGDLPEYGKVVTINGVKAFYAKKGTVLLEDAFRFNIRYAHLLEINELPDLPLPSDMYVYLEKKNPQGIHESHTVKEGETLSMIAQAEAMQLRYLKYYNHISSNEEPAPGAVLLLQRYSPEKPTTIIKDQAPAGSDDFAGSAPQAVPQGSTRTRRGYISKKQIKEAQEKDITQLRSKDLPALQEETKAPAGIREKYLAPPPSVTLMTDHDEHQNEDADKPAEKEELPDSTQLAERQNSFTPPPEKEIVTTVSQNGESSSKTEEGTPESSDEIAETGKDLNDLAVDSSLMNEKIQTENAALSPPKENDVDDEIVSEPATERVPPQKEEHPLVQAEPIEPLQPIEGVPTSSVATPTPEEVKMPEKVSIPAPRDEPKDEFDRLKAKLDRVVYASDGAVPSGSASPSPSSTNKEESPASAPKPANKDINRFYVVKKGDTAFSISKQFNITMRELMDWNDLNFDAIKVGQKLRVKP